MEEINELSNTKNIIVLGRLAQAHGAKIRNRKIGGFGNTTIFSFYPTKNMTVGGDGGMVTTNDPNVSAQIIKMQNVGRKTKYSHDQIGYTMRLNSVNVPGHRQNSVKKSR